MLSSKDVLSLDSSGLHKDYEEWPHHCEEALALKVAACNMPDLDRVIYAGMGGSGASGDILADCFTSVLEMPFTVLKDYHLPKFVGRNDLVLVVSCSGNTAEALSVVKEALERKCGVAAVSSGGQLEKFCKEKGIAFTKIKMLRVPRSSFPYLFFPSLNILLETIHLKEIRGQLDSSVLSVKKLHGEISVDSPIERNPAKQIASRISAGVPVIYSSAANTGVGIRFRTALNENAKMIAHTAVIPELCHNEVEGWTKKGAADIFKPIFIRHSRESSAVSQRFEVVREIIESTGLEVYQIWETGEDYFSRVLRSIYLLDYASIYAAILRNIDPIIIPNIDTLKEKLRSA